MISANAKLSIRWISLECIQIKEFQQRYVEKLLEYIQLLLDYPNKYPGLLFVVPSDTHTGMFALLDGHHKFCAYIMTGRKYTLCVVIEEPLSDSSREVERMAVDHVGGGSSPSPRIMEAT